MLVEVHLEIIIIIITTTITVIIIIITVFITITTTPLLRYMLRIFLGHRIVGWGSPHILLDNSSLGVRCGARQMGNLRQ